MDQSNWHQLLRESMHLVQMLLLRVLISYWLPRRPPTMDSLLVIAPHPDDEVLGAGGMILAALEHGQSVHILYLTDGEAAGGHPDPDRVRAERSRITNAVMGSLGIPTNQIHRFSLPDGAVPREGTEEFASVVHRLANLVDAIRPDRVLATHSLDYWPYDHVACAELAKAAVALAQHRPAVDLYWVWGWYNIRPWRLCESGHLNLVAIDISPWVTVKRQLVCTYLDALTPSGTPWSGVLPPVIRHSACYKVEIIEQSIPLT